MSTDGDYSPIGGKADILIAALPITVNQDINIVAPGIFITFNAFTYNNIPGLLLSAVDEITIDPGSYELVLAGNYRRNNQGSNHVGVNLTAELAGVLSATLLWSCPLAVKDAAVNSRYSNSWVFQLILTVTTTLRINAQRSVNLGSASYLTNPGGTLYFKKLA